jgi:hypothetical protein
MAAPAAPNSSTTSAAGAVPAQRAPEADRTAIRPFEIRVPEGELVQLRLRLAATRWPDQETAPDRSQGVQLTKLQHLASYWGTGYDRRRAEARFNALPQFVTEIDGR